MFDRIMKMYALAVWDNHGRMYMPIWGYDGEISHYALAIEALQIFNQEWFDIDTEFTTP